MSTTKTKTSFKSGDKAMSRDGHPVLIHRIWTEEGVEFAVISYLDGHQPGPVGGRVAGTEEEPLWEHRVKDGKVIHSNADYYNPEAWVTEKGLQPYSTTPQLSRDKADRVSIGHLRAGQEAYLLRSGKLKFQGTVVAVRPEGKAGCTLVLLTAEGKTHTVWGGSATMYYTPQAQPQAEATTDGAEPQEGEAKAMASKKNTPSTTPVATEPQVDLHKELVAQLKEAGLKVTPKWSPTKKYAAYKQADGKTLAYVFAQTSSGIKVKAGLELKELDRAAKKAWLDNSKEAPFSIRGFFTQDNLGLAVAAIQATAAKLAEAKAAKAEAKKKTTKKESAPQPAPEADGLVTVSLPPAFYADHVARELPAGTVVKQTKKAVTVALSPEELAELRSDASHYAFSMAEGGFEGRGLIASAKATLKALDKAGV